MRARRASTYSSSSGFSEEVQRPDHERRLPAADREPGTAGQHQRDGNRDAGSTTLQTGAGRGTTTLSTRPGAGATGPIPFGTSSIGTPGAGAAGGIIGVTSKSKDKSIRLYNGRSHYNEWAFIFTQQVQQPGVGGAGIGAPGAPGQRGQPSPGGSTFTPNGRGRGTGRGDQQSISRFARARLQREPGPARDADHTVAFARSRPR